jgi:hypothetical protein
MADLARIGAALGSVNTLWELVRNAQDAQLAMKISAELGNIQGQLIAVQQQVLSAQEESQNLRKEVERYRSFVFHHSASWHQLPSGLEDGPFCPTCLSEGFETRLSIAFRESQSTDYRTLYCPKSAHGSNTMGGMIFEVPKSLIPANYFYVSGMWEASCEIVRRAPGTLANTAFSAI